jgi:hypothetical protein
MCAMLFSVTLYTTPYGWNRQLKGRAEKNIDERRITVDARPSGENTLVLSGGVCLQDLHVQVQIFNKEPGTIGEQIARPAEVIGWLQYLEEYDCLAGWFCVGPVNFEEIWQMPRHLNDKWKLELELGPVESVEPDEWLWDTKKTPLIWVTGASFVSAIETKEKA